MDIFPVILFFGGLIGGLYAANVGGGALVSFPLLVLAGLPIHAAIATQRFSAAILELVSAVRFQKEKLINLKFAIFLGFIAALGSFLGSNLVLAINERILNLIIGVILLIVSAVLFNRKKIGLKEKKITRRSLVLTSISTFLLAIYGGFFGAGFGFFIMIVLVLMGYTFIKSAAMGRVIGFFMSATGAVVFAHAGLINYTYGLSLGAGFAIGSWIGIGFALKKGNEFIRGLLLVVVLLSVLKLISGFLNINII
ncbi:hypothetical protein A2165_01075 [Candidatus Curtissbacteria bacterium RBG_13_40_7]|uniref:Probable membrane transporter protein n=1 Tax=Candidatus Curtissbacteria bacterium RBG_13_40_7 TaxID=1797706 RepID=A0A1F5FX98_9BACT|nr:MAG: hypothetical protein A2165_01075 [Candidatus Curtissbacteria bacterium RBG_13_40_7]